MRPLRANFAGQVTKGVSRCQVVFMRGEEELVCPDTDLYQEILSSEGNLVHLGVMLMYGEQQTLTTESVAWELSSIPPDSCAQPYFVALQVPTLALQERVDDVVVFQKDE
eukprot:11414674-Karenia_brevis.AAC.1